MASESELAIKVKAIVDDAITNLARVKAGVQDLDRSNQAGAKSFDNAKKSSEGLAGALNKLGTHYRAVGQAADLMGVGVDGAVSKTGALIDVIESLGSKIPIFLGVAAAVVGIAEAFNFVKQSVADAGALQDAMARLGATVRDQGGDWNALAADFTKWAELQESTTTFSKVDVIDGVKQLTSAGMGLNDAMKVTRIAEDASAATGQSLTTVNHGLVEAMHGRTQALSSLGIGTKQSIKDGMAFNDVLKAIEKQMGGSAAASASTYNGALKQLGNAFTDLRETIGTPLLNTLTSIVHGITDFVEGLKEKFAEALAAVKDWAAQHKRELDIVAQTFVALGGVVRIALDMVIMAVKDGLRLVLLAIDVFVDGLDGNWGQLWKDIVGTAKAGASDGQHVFGNWFDNLVTIATAGVRKIKDLISGIGTAMSFAAQGQWGLAAGVLDVTGQSVMSGIKLKPWNFGGDELDRLFSHKGGLPNLADWDTGVASTVGGGTKKTPRVKKAKTTKRNEDVISAIGRGLEAVLKEIAKEVMTPKLGSIMGGIGNVMQVAGGLPVASRPDTFAQAIGAEVAKKIAGFSVQRDKESGNFQKISFSPIDFLLQAIQNTKAFGDIMKVVTEIMQVVAQIFDALRPVIDLFLRAVILVVNGFISLWNVLARLLRLLGIHVELLDKINADFSDLSQNAAPFIQIVHDIPTMNELASGNISPLYPAGTGHDTIVDSVTNPITDGLKDPGLGGGLLGGILEVVASLEIVKTLLKVSGIKSIFGGGGGGGIVGLLTGGKGIGGLIPSLLNNLNGLGLNIGPSETSADAMLADQQAAQNSLFGKLSSFLGSSPSFISGAFGAGTTVGGVLSAVGGGALAGALFGQMMGGGSHVTNGSAGGAIGGTLGLLSMAGPWGVAADALIGAIVGGLFGHAAPNAHDNPDIVNTGTYGQEMADYQGSGVERAAMNANGQSFTESSSMLSALGGTGEATFISNWIKSVGSQAAQAVLGPLASIFTGDASDITGGKNGTLNLANGVSIYWSDLIKDAQDAITDIGQSFSQMGQSVGGNLNAIAGNITRFVSGAQNDLTGTVKDSPSSSTSSAPPAGASGGGDVHVTVNGDINGYQDAEQLGYDIADAQARRARFYTYGFQRVPST